MNWIPLTDEKQLVEIVETSQEKPVVIFKHSTRCSISSTALNRFERAWDSENTPAYYLDLIAYRPISGQIAEQFAVEHQSPQVLVIDKGACPYSATHWDISVDEIKPYLHG
ncbi:bacillithiol system redox-active protein YtxJ [Aquirufa sp.]|jgi:bacillithiol system protein YtxJ|uniref:bacillithiol system redox-active protein YtxJ n=1 Tax=Aquirufa sp. TaxID=2676249 RepID=UPI0037841922